MEPLQKSGRSYLERAARLFKWMAVLFFLSVVFTLLRSTLFKDMNTLADLLTGVPIILVVFLTPVGLYALARSFASEEATGYRRLLYLLGYIFFVLVTLFTIVMVLTDISKLF